MANGTCYSTDPRSAVAPLARAATSGCSKNFRRRFLASFCWFCDAADDSIARLKNVLFCHGDAKLFDFRKKQMRSASLVKSLQKAAAKLGIFDGFQS